MTEWINVEDKLPLPSERVIIISDEGLHTGYWDGYDKENPSWQCDPQGSYAADGYVFDVKYWMPLPNPPEDHD